MKAHQDNNQKINKDSGRVLAGVIILVIGLILLAGQLGMDHIFPRWLFSWPLILCVVGLIIGATSNFKNPASFILIGLGTVFLLQKNVDFNVWKLVVPAFLTGLGIWLLIDKKETNKGSNRRDPDYTRTDYIHKENNPMDSISMKHQDSGSSEDSGLGASSFTHYDAKDTDESRQRNQSTTENDFLNSTAIFSEEKKTIVSKNLQGGEIVNIFGGTDINLIQADLKGPIVIDIFQLFAGTKIIVPPHWTVHSKVVSLFGEVDDRRFIQDTHKDDRKTIYLKGTSIFGGVTIKSM